MDREGSWEYIRYIFIRYRNILSLDLVSVGSRISWISSPMTWMIKWSDDVSGVWGHWFSFIWGAMTRCSEPLRGPSDVKFDWRWFLFLQLVPVFSVLYYFLLSVCVLFVAESKVTLAVNKTLRVLFLSEELPSCVSTGLFNARSPAEAEAQDETRWGRTNVTLIRAVHRSLLPVA